MKHLFVIFIALLISCTTENRRSATFVATSQDTTSLRHLKQVEWPKAYRDQDTLLLDRILADEFQMVDASGAVTDKSFELNWIKKNASDPDSFFYDIKRLDIFENGTAVVSGTGHMMDDTTETTYQSSNVLIKRDGIWQALSSHVSGVVTSPRKK